MNLDMVQLRIGKLWREFVRLEAASGILLAVCALAAVVMENSPLRSWYDTFIHYDLVGGMGGFHEPLRFWVNDVLMTVFFLLVGLEIKREMVDGELSRPAQRVLPAVAALGGMIVPAVIYVLFNFGNAHALRGWAIPSATDIAFSVAVLTILGRRVPVSLKVFLLALAIFDDLGAIVIIALFYTSDMSFPFLAAAVLVTALLFLMLRRQVARLFPYLLVGSLLWFFVFRSGVHPTIAGVVLALMIPEKTRGNVSPLRILEKALHPWVSFGIIPLFGFVNSGVALSGIDLGVLFGEIPLGIACGLFFGKQLGIFFSSLLLIRTRLAALPTDARWSQLYGVSMVAGIGFTMSLFIGGLAFEQEAEMALVRVGVIGGSLLSALVGYLFLRFLGSTAED